MLHDALYAPSVTYTLISLGALDKVGYYTSITAGCLKLVSPHGEQVGHIPHSACHLYKVKHVHESAHTAELLSAMELHCCLGHIAVASTHKLVESRAVIVLCRSRRILCC